MESKYKVKLEIFEGPLDLLLYLIRKNEVDIYNIPIGKITKQYLEYMELMRMLDLNIAGEFMVMAATLMYIKSKMLLPVEERMPDEEEAGEDPRLLLVRQLLEYRKFKDAAQYLHNQEHSEGKKFARHVPPDIKGDTPIVEVNIFALIGAFQQALSRVEKAGIHEIVGEDYTVEEKIRGLKKILQEKGQFSLTRLFDDMKTKLEVVVTFLALLEMIRLKIAWVVQKDLFDEIIVESNSGALGK